eukprot:7608123-Karenia_brevis.AAC.1
MAVLAISFSSEDQWHQFYHMLLRALVKIRQQLMHNAFLRKALNECNMSMSGTMVSQSNLNHQDSIRLKVMALKLIANHNNGLLIAAGWYRCGYITWKQQKEWRPELKDSRGQ